MALHAAPDVSGSIPGRHTKKNYGCFLRRPLSALGVTLAISGDSGCLTKIKMIKLVWLMMFTGVGIYLDNDVMPSKL